MAKRGWWSVTFRLVTLTMLAVVWIGVTHATAQEPAGAGNTVDAPAAATANAEPAGPPKAETDDKPKTAFELWVARMKTTGTTGIFLFVLSIFGMAFILERLVRLRRSAIVPNGLAERADELWRSDDFDGIQNVCNRQPSVLGRVIGEIVRHRHLNAADISMMAGDVASRELRKQQNKSYPIAVVAGLAPLLGLMGTVVGMVGAFETVAAVGSMGDPSVLADDISKALLTTAWGLAIAIPTLALYHYFKTRTNQFGLVLEEQVSALITEWFHPRK